MILMVAVRSPIVPHILIVLSVYPGSDQKIPSALPLSDCFPLSSSYYSCLPARCLSLHCSALRLVSRHNDSSIDTGSGPNLRYDQTQMCRNIGSANGCFRDSVIASWVSHLFNEPVNDRKRQPHSKPSNNALGITNDCFISSGHDFQRASCGFGTLLLALKACSTLCVAIG
jgi:hypothetical protein